MLDGWAFKPPIDGTKWQYLEKHVLPLSYVWRDAERFKQLQDIARKHKGELEAENAELATHVCVCVPAG